jgi:hypothetical protein
MGAMQGHCTAACPEGDGVKESGHRAVRRLFAIVSAFAAVVANAPADALPSFAAQTGARCGACHVGGNWPQLTPWGRFFKLSGYTAGEAPVSRSGVHHVPGGFIAQGGITWADKAHDENGNLLVPRNATFLMDQVNAFVATKLTDFAGVFLEYHWQNLTQIPSGKGGWEGTWAGGSDVMDLRAVHFFHPGNHELLVGLDSNNQPTVQDVWNTVPAWTFPFYGSPVAVGPVPSPLIDGIGQQVGSLGLYTWFDRMVYAEFSVYRDAESGFFKWMGQGNYWDSPGGATRVGGYNPYWRLAFNHEWGASSIEAGTFGMNTKVFPDNLEPQGSTDHYTDVGFDTQYQWLTNLHKVTLRATYLYERQSYNASFPLGLTSNPTNRLRQMTFSASYWHDERWGLSFGYTQIQGTPDATLYGVTSPTGALLTASPYTSQYTIEADYLLTQNIKLMLQYAGYGKYNGRHRDIDGAGRAYWNNNSLWFNIFVAF